MREPLCTDFHALEPTSDETYVPTAGSVSITITPGVGDESSRATAVVWKLEGDDEAPTVSMPARTIADVTVGWSPG